MGKNVLGNRQELTGRRTPNLWAPIKDMSPKWKYCDEESSHRTTVPEISRRTHRAQCSQSTCHEHLICWGARREMIQDGSGAKHCAKGAEDGVCPAWSERRKKSGSRSKGEPLGRTGVYDYVFPFFEGIDLDGTEWIWSKHMTYLFRSIKWNQPIPIFKKYWPATLGQDQHFDHQTPSLTGKNLK